MRRNFLLAALVCGALAVLGYLSGAADGLLGRTPDGDRAARDMPGNGVPVDRTAWRRVASGVNVTAYADVDSVIRDGPLVSLRALLDFAKPPFDGNNLPYLSLTMRNEYRCDERRYRSLSITSHAGHMASGERPYTTDEPGAWEAVRSTSIQKDLFELACAAQPGRPLSPQAAR